MARTDGGSNRDSGVGGAGTPGSGRDSSSSSSGRSGGSSSASSGRSSGGASSGAASSGGRSAGASSSASTGRSSGSASAGRSSGGINAGGGGDNSRSSGAASSGGNSRGGAGTAASAGRSSSGTSSASAGRSSAGTGRSSGAGTIGAGLSGSGLADRGGRVTGGGFDSGRFGDAPVSEKGGRVGSSPQAERGGRVTSPDAGRFAGGSSVGRQSSKGGTFSNGGRNSDRAGTAARASASPARSASVGTGLGAGLTAPSRSARAAETASMDALSRSRTEARSRNYGAGLAQSARAVEDRSMGALHDYDREVVGVRSAGAGFTEVQRRDGTIERRDGTRASRNNNPGNLEYGEFAKSKGAIGTDGRFGVFATPAQGRQAMEDLVFGPSYAGRTIQEAVERYAPPHENNSRSYASSIAAAAGVPVGTTVRDLTPSQRTAMVDQMTRVEGNKPHATTTIAQGTPRGTAPSERRNSRFEQTYMASAAPVPAAQPANVQREGRLPGLAGIVSGAPSPTTGRLGTASTFDRTNLTAGVQAIADAIDVAVPGAGINSAYRSPEHNARVGGAKGSQHVAGNAIDVNMRGWTDDQRRAALDAAIASGARGIGIYNGGTTLHADARPGSKSMWGGNPAGQYAAMSFAQAPDWARASLESWKSNDATPPSRVPSTSELMAQPAPTASAPTRTASADRFQATYLEGVPSSPAQAAKPERTVGDRLVAGAIDVGVGLLPGIGTAAGLYSMAAPMVGLPTVGEMALSLRDRNQTGANRAIAGKNEGGAGREIDERLRIARAEPTAMPQVAEPEATGSFAEKYLEWSGDGISRPTPMEKWGAQASYAL